MDLPTFTATLKLSIPTMTSETILATCGEAILDCAIWNSEGISSRVTFVYFWYLLIFFAVFGGLLAVFTFTMNFVTGVLLFLAEKWNCCNEKCFRCLLSFGIFFAVFSGLLAVFTFTMKFASGALYCSQLKYLYSAKLAKYVCKTVCGL